jgi:hypothetical protein
MQQSEIGRLLCHFAASNRFLCPFFMQQSEIGHFCAILQHLTFFLSLLYATILNRSIGHLVK